MLAIIAQDGTSLIDPSRFKSSSSSCFPISSSLECSTNVWSPDNSQLYLANSSSITRYTPSDFLLEELYSGSDTVTCLATMKGNSSTLFFAAANRVWSLDCDHSPGKILSSLEPHKCTVTCISVSHDGTLLASVSAFAVFVHDLTQSSYSQLRGLPDRKLINHCVFHQHFRTRLLLCIGCDLVIYDAMQPGSPLKTVRIPGDGDIIGVSASPFSKTLVAAATSNGNVALVDLDKEKGILKTINLKTSLTCCAFTAEGAAIYLGTENGKLLILDLRSLEKEPKSFTIGDGGAPIRTINVQSKSKSHPSETASVKGLSTIVTSSPQRPVSSARTMSASSTVSGLGAKSPVRLTVTSKIRGGGVTPKKKLFSPARNPLSERKNLGLDARLATAKSPTLPRRVNPLKFQRSKNREGDEVRAPSPSSCGTTEPANVRQCTGHAPSHKVVQEVESLGLGPAPESISGHLAAMRIRSGPLANGEPKDGGNLPKNTARRIVSESMENTTIGRKLRLTSTGTADNKVSSSKAVQGVGRRQQLLERRSTTPDNIDQHLDMSSPELPREPVTPISLGKNTTKTPSDSAMTCTGHGVLGLTRPEVTKWAKGNAREKAKVAEVKKARFAQHPEAEEAFGESDGSGDEGGANPKIFGEEVQCKEREQELSLQVSPCRPTAPPAWLQSPHRPTTANLNMNAAAQDFLRNIVHDVMYDFQRETKAEMMGLHLDLVRMGRGWKRELREVMGEQNREIQELRAENKRLKEENERLRRGYCQ